MYVVHRGYFISADRVAQTSGKKKGILIRIVPVITPYRLLSLLFHYGWYIMCCINITDVTEIHKMIAGG